MSNYFCKECGKSISENDDFCSYCGTKIELDLIDGAKEEGSIKGKKSKSKLATKAISLVIIIGIVGILVFGYSRLFNNNNGLDFVYYQTDEGFHINYNGNEIIIDDEDEAYAIKSELDEENLMNTPIKEGVLINRDDYGTTYIGEDFLSVLTNGDLYLVDYDTADVEIIDDVSYYQVSADGDSILCQEADELLKISTKNFDDESIVDDITNFIATSDFNNIFITTDDGELLLIDLAGEEREEINDEISRNTMALVDDYLLFNSEDNGYIVEISSLEEIEEFDDDLIDIESTTKVIDKLYFRLSYEDVFYTLIDKEVDEVDNAPIYIDFNKYQYKHLQFRKDIKNLAGYEGFVGESDDDFIISFDGVETEDYSLNEYGYDNNANWLWVDNSFILEDRENEELIYIKGDDFEEEELEVNYEDTEYYFFGGSRNHIMAYEYDTNIYYRLVEEELEEIDDLDTDTSTKTGFNISYKDEIFMINDDKAFHVDKDGKIEEIYDGDDIVKYAVMGFQNWAAFQTDEDDIYVVKDLKKTELIVEDIEAFEFIMGNMYYIDSDDRLYKLNGTKSVLIAKDVDDI